MICNKNILKLKIIEKIKKLPKRKAFIGINLLVLYKSTHFKYTYFFFSICSADDIISSSTEFGYKAKI